MRSTAFYNPVTAHEKLFGHYFVSTLTDGLKFGVCTIAGRRMSKQDIVREFGLGNFAAFRRLDQYAVKQGFKDLLEFFQMSPTDLATLNGFGVTMLCALTAVAHRRNISIRDWEKDGVTFDSLKSRIVAEEAREKKIAKSRKSAKRSRALHEVGTRLLRTAS